MTKIAFMRNSGQPMPGGNKYPVSSVPFLPTGMSSGPVMQFPVPRPSAQAVSQAYRPKPTVMTPTTRFNSNPTVICDQTPGGRISKPLMEKRRRARINQCLSQLKQIVVDSAGEYTQRNKCKLEKADILELTVNYVKKLHTQKVEGHRDGSDPYRSGYAECAKQVCSLLEEMPLETGTKESLSFHLAECLDKLKPEASPTLFCIPLSPTTSLSTSSSSSSSPNATMPTPSILQNSPPLSCRSGGSDEYYFEFDHEEDDEEAEEEEEEEEVVAEKKTLLHYKKLMLPLNLKVNKDEDEDVWRPW